MAADLPSRQQEILDGLNKKSHLKLKVFNQTAEVFSQLKDILNEMSNDLNDLLDNSDRRVRLEYRTEGSLRLSSNLQMTYLYSVCTPIFSSLTGIIQSGKMNL